MRLSRSLLVTSGIVLAIAFLIAIQINDAFADGMRRWIAESAHSPRFVALRAERSELDARLADARASLRQWHALDAKSAVATDDEIRAMANGRSLDDLRNTLGELPTDNATLAAGIKQDANFRATFRQWLDDAERARAIRDELSHPKLLESQLADNGVPTRSQDVAAAKTQTRWLLGLALLVAFVGILNAMLMSVTERFREIGTMKCLGALDSFIVKLFLIESLFQGIVGTTIGLLLGVGASVLLNLATYGSAAFNGVSLPTIFTAIGISAVVGVVLTIIGAIWPAWQAAKMHPIEAMRVEA